MIYGVKSNSTAGWKVVSCWVHLESQCMCLGKCERLQLVAQFVSQVTELHQQPE